MAISNDNSSPEGLSKVESLLKIQKNNKNNKNNVLYISPLVFARNSLYVIWFWYLKDISTKIKDYNDKSKNPDQSNEVLFFSSLIFISIGVINILGSFQGQKTNIAQEAKSFFAKEGEKSNGILEKIKKFLPPIVLLLSLGWSLSKPENKENLLANGNGLLLLAFPVLFFLELKFVYSFFTLLSFSFLFFLLGINNFKIFTDNIDLKFTKENIKTFETLYRYLLYLFILIRFYQAVKFFVPDKYFHQFNLVFLGGYFVVNIFKNQNILKNADVKTQQQKPYVLKNGSIIEYLYFIYLNILFINLIADYYCNRNQIFIKFTQTVSKNILNYGSLYETLKSNIVLENINFLLMFLLKELIHSKDNNKDPLKNIGENKINEIKKSFFGLVETIFNIINYIVLSIIPIIGFNIYLIKNLLKNKNQKKDLRKILRSVNLKNIQWKNRVSDQLIIKNGGFLIFEGVFILLNLVGGSLKATVFNLNHMNFFILFYLLFFQKDHLINEFNFEKIKSSVVDLRKGKKNLQEIQEELIVFEKALYFAYDKQNEEDMLKIIIPIIEKDETTS